MALLLLQRLESPPHQAIETPDLTATALGKKSSLGDVLTRGKLGAWPGIYEEEHSPGRYRALPKGLRYYTACNDLESNLVKGSAAVRVVHYLKHQDL
jgi:hypothetical protein